MNGNINIILGFIHLMQSFFNNALKIMYCIYRKERERESSYLIPFVLSFKYKISKALYKILVLYNNPINLLIKKKQYWQILKVKIFLKLQF